MLCLSVCMFSLYGCSNEDSPTNSDGSFEGLDVTNLKRGDVMGAQYVKNETGQWVPQKITPLSEGDFNVEVANRAWGCCIIGHISENGKTEENEYEGISFDDFSFDKIGECTIFSPDIAFGIKYRYQSSYTYDATTGGLRIQSKDGVWYSQPSYYVIGLEKAEDGVYMWMTSGNFLLRYKETTKDELMKEYPKEWDDYKDQYGNKN